MIMVRFCQQKHLLAFSTCVKNCSNSKTVDMQELTFHKFCSLVSVKPPVKVLTTAEGLIDCIGIVCLVNWIFLFYLVLQCLITIKSVLVYVHKHLLCSVNTYRITINHTRTLIGYLYVHRAEKDCIKPNQIKGKTCEQYDGPLVKVNWLNTN